MLQLLAKQVQFRLSVALLLSSFQPGELELELEYLVQPPIQPSAKRTAAPAPKLELLRAPPAAPAAATKPGAP
jgi:hypothetical protein